MFNRSPALPLAVLTAVYATVIFFYSARFDYNLSGLICIGERFARPDLVGEDQVVLAGSRGYDGQFYFFAAQDPLIRDAVFRKMDVAAYRYARAFYPWLAAFFALGRRALLPYTLLGVNLAGLMMGAYFASRMLRSSGLGSGYLLIYGLLSGFILAVLRDLAAPLAMGLVTGGVYYLGRDRPAVGCVFLAAAALTRELLVIIPLVYLFYGAVFRRNTGRVIACFFSLLPLVAWSGYVYLTLKDPPYRGGWGNFGSPLNGVIGYGMRLFRHGGLGPETIYFILFVLISLFTLILALKGLVSRPDEIGTLFAIFALLPLFMTELVWVEPWSYGRVLIPGAVFLFLDFARRGDRICLVPLYGHMALTLVAFWWLAVT